MTRVVEREDFHVVLEDADGDRRFVLTRCPVCHQRLTGITHVDGEQPGDSTPVPPHVHLAQAHGPECFGLEPLHRERQARLIGGGIA